LQRFVVHLFSVAVCGFVIAACDLIGRVVNLAARVTGEAEPGEILVTELVADYVGGRLQLEDRGLRDLRGVPQPRHLLAVDWSDSDQRAAPRSGG